MFNYPSAQKKHAHDSWDHKKQQVSELTKKPSQEGTPWKINMEPEKHHKAPI